MNNEQFSDITIIYGYGGSSRFKAHKVLLASASLWFQAAFTNPAFIVSQPSKPAHTTPTNPPLGI